jgi:hypothetical protein
MIETVVGAVESGMRWGYDSSRRVALRVVAGCKSRMTTLETAAEQSRESLGTNRMDLLLKMRHCVV